MKTLVKLLFIPAALVIFSLAACSVSEKIIVATVNGKHITIEDFINELKLYHLSETTVKNPSNAEKYFEVKKEILNSMIKEKIFLEEAKRMGIKIPDAEIALAVQNVRKDYPGDSFFKYLRDKGINFGFWKEKIKISLINKKLTDIVTADSPAVNENEIKDYYEKNQNLFSVPEEIHAYQIVAKTEEEAYRILKELNQGKKFEELANTYSIGPEGKKGGDMGFFSRGSMPAAFDNVLFNLKEGRISKVVSSEYGYHIFKVTGKNTARIKQLPEVRNEIIEELKTQKKDELFSQWLKDKIAKAKIKRNNGLLANVK